MSLIERHNPARILAPEATAPEATAPQRGDRRGEAQSVSAVPTMAELRAALPAECFEPSLAVSSAYAFASVAAVVAVGAAAWAWLPMSLSWLPAWLIYAWVVGTAGCGVWVVAHECGHGAFCKNDRIQNTIGFILHSALLVPYFSWQRSHAVHHAKTNHLTDGETHVPATVDSRSGRRSMANRQRFGASVYGVGSLIGHLIFGWPLYLLTGATGGSSRGVTNHFWPWPPLASSLFPARWAARVVISTGGVAVTVALLALAARSYGSLWPVLALYGGPYLVTNLWLVLYTWLQHTNPDVPHYDDEQWSFVRGAFCSVDRPYPWWADAVHHRIGTTHVAHHLFPAIPHYRARKATEALAAAYPDLYRYDDTPILAALWRTATDCVAVGPAVDGWRFVPAKGTAGESTVGESTAEESTAY